MPYVLAGGGAPKIPSQLEIDNALDFVQRMYPTSEIQVSKGVMATQDPPATCTEAKERVIDWAGPLAAQDPRVRFYGMLEGDDSVKVKNAKGQLIGGCARGQFGWGVTGGHTPPPRLGHMYGRKHTQACDPYGEVDPGYPHPSGLIGDALLGDAQGLDSGGSLAGPELRDWRDGWTDIMGYCAKSWISDYTYGQILGNICAGDPANCPDHAAITGSRAAGPPRRPAKASASPSRAGNGGGRLRLSVSGRRMPSGRISLNTLAALRGVRLT